MPNARQEAVILIFSPEGEPTHAIRKNGEVIWYKMEKMSYGDFTEFLGSDKVRDE